ncbi:MAG: LCP family protein [Actinomycetota bacterium]|nr:LCP family protein [Actinomycetota bacterium]
MTADVGTTARRGFVRRHKVIAALVALLLVLAAAVAGFAFYLNAQIDEVARYESKLREPLRPPPPTGEAAEAQNILLLGTDKGHGETIEDELADGRWTPGAFRSDTVMIVHLPADRDEAYLVSIPRDSYVRVPGFGRQKVNAAFSFGGPDLAMRTIEDLTGVYLDHVAMIDWTGFRHLTSAIGGVEVTVAETFFDPKNNRTWQAGSHQLEGQEALDYVRTRYGLENGDFDRIKRQQNFLRAVMRKTVSNGTLANPVKLTNLVQAITDAATVDAGWTTAEIRETALDLRHLRSNDVVYLTAPTRGYRDVQGIGSVVLLAQKESRALWRSLRTDDVGAYLDKYGGERLPDAAAIP